MTGVPVSHKSSSTTRQPFVPNPRNHHLLQGVGHSGEEGTRSVLRLGDVGDGDITTEDLLTGVSHDDKEGEGEEQDEDVEQEEGDGDSLTAGDGACGRIDG